MFGSQKKLELQLAEAHRRIAELEAWKARHQESEQRIEVIQLELAGEIANSIRRGASISRKTWEMLDRMSRYDAEFQAAAADLAGIDSRIGALTDSISTTGSAIYQTSAAVEQMSASITKIAGESSTRFHDIKNLAQLSQAGQREMDSTLQIIQEVTSGIDDLRSFLDMIDEIAGKTSILSMNAAIQAAHAGEVGKGFAVVADEVRRLAESSAANAAGITKRLGGLIEAIHQAEASSQKTAKILAEAEEKVTKAAAGFQEIEQGTQELALGGREMLAGILSLRETSTEIASASQDIARNSSAVTEKVGHLRTDTRELEAVLQAVRSDSADLNGAGMSLAQTTVKQLAAGRDSGAGFDPPFAASLVLQHLTWVTRVRGVLDGQFQVASGSLEDHHSCELGRWLDTEGKALSSQKDYQELVALHTQMHDQAKALMALQEAGKTVEAEESFPRLVALSDDLAQRLPSLAAVWEGQEVLIRWSPAFELGHPLVDRQHQGLVDLTNKLYRAIRGGQARAVLGGVLDELVDYTVTHFRDEEALFQATAYPGKKAHLDQHQGFVRTASALQADFRAGKAVLGSDTVEFLRDWLLNHIQGSDRGYTKYLNP